MVSASPAAENGRQLVNQDPPRFPPAPGYRQTAYRPPLTGELYRLEDCDQAGQVAKAAADVPDPRWIVEPLNAWHSTIDNGSDAHAAALAELDAWRRDNWPALPIAVALRAAVQQFVASDDEASRDSIVSVLQDAA